MIIKYGYKYTEVVNRRVILGPVEELCIALKFFIVFSWYNIKGLFTIDPFRLQLLR